MPDQLINLFDYEAAASEALDANALGYYASGSVDEITLRDNRTAFDRIKIAPKMLVGVADRTMSTKLLEHQLPTPIAIAPMAVTRLAHPDGELAMVKAAGELNIPMTLSTMSSTALEDVAAAATSPLFFQLYVYRDRHITEQLVLRAEAAGYKALVLTVDVPVQSKRETNIRIRFKLPDHVKLANLEAFQLDNMKAQEEHSALAAYADSQFDPSLSWKDVTWLANLTKMPVFVKGVLRPDDAQRAIDAGAAGVIVSNHGGRQLDTAPAAIDALPAITAAIGLQGIVMMDGGVRRGSDIFKALALGAKAVFVGRPILWGLAVNGQQGVYDVLNILINEFDITMALSGARSIDEITPDYIFQSPFS